MARKSAWRYELIDEQYARCAVRLAGGGSDGREQVEPGDSQRVDLRGVRIAVSMLKQSLNYGEDHRGRDAEHQHPVTRFERSEQSPARRHCEGAISERRVVDGGMIIGGSEVGKLATEFYGKRPQSDFYEMGGERQDSYVGYEDRVHPEADADAAELQVAANYPDDQSEEKCVKDDRAESRRDADE
jgi:hypothetical protein